jgi:hypothetical protein
MRMPTDTLARFRLRRSRPAVAAILALLLGGFLALTTMERADAASMTWQGSIATANGTTSTVRATWQVSPPAVQLTVTTQSLAPGKCVTVFFDWAATGHYDGRAVRNCQSNTTLTHAFSEPVPTTITSGGHKNGGCYGLKDQHGACVGTGSIDFDWTPWPDTTRSAPCDLSWVLRDANGHLTSFIDSHPTSAALRGGTC